MHVYTTPYELKCKQKLNDMQEYDKNGKEKAKKEYRCKDAYEKKRAEAAAPALSANPSAGT